MNRNDHLCQIVVIMPEIMELKQVDESFADIVLRTCIFISSHTHTHILYSGIHGHKNGLNR